MKLKVFLILLLIAAGAGAVFVSMGGLTANAVSTTYLTSAASVGDVTDEVAATGTIAATESYGLTFGSPAHLVDDAAADNAGSATWAVESVDVALGDRVAKGQQLATGSTNDLVDELTAAIANRRSAALQLEIAQENFDDASGTDETRQTRLAMYQAQSQLVQAEHAQHDLEAQIAAATLVAPIDGTVVAVNVSSGLDAPSGDAIVVAAGTFQVIADVVESDISRIDLQQAATVTIDALDADVAGTVSAIAPAASSGDAGTGVVSYAVTITLDEPPAALRAGMSADITITIASAKDVLTVPTAALNGSDGNYSVQVLDADGLPEVQPVEVGLVTSALAEITNGLTAGDQVITGTAADRAQTTTNGNFPGGGGQFVAPGGGTGPRFQTDPGN